MTANIGQLDNRPEGPANTPLCAIGTKVRVIGNNGKHYAPFGAVGIVRGHGGENCGYAIEILEPPEWNNGHRCLGFVATARKGQWIDPEDLQTLPKQEQEAGRKRKVYPRYPVTVIFRIHGMSVGSTSYSMSIDTSAPPSQVVKMGAMGNFALKDAIALARQWKKTGGHLYIDGAGHRRTLFAKYGKHLLPTLLLVERLSKLEGRLQYVTNEIHDVIHARELNMYYGKKGGV